MQIVDLEVLKEMPCHDGIVGHRRVLEVPDPCVFDHGQDEGFGTIFSRMDDTIVGKLF